MQYYCNPINYNYKYQFNYQKKEKLMVSREGADPSLILFKGKYFLFPSMTCGFLHSDDLVHWEFQGSKALPGYDYAPDVCVVDDWIYFCASSNEKGVFYRTKNPFADEYECIEGAFPFWDPSLFYDEDGRLYLYYGSSMTKPLYGVELDKETLMPISEPVPLVEIDTEIKGFERNGENHIPERTKEEIEDILAKMDQANVPGSIRESVIGYIKCLPYVEGAWMNKKKEIYYLQYGTPGSRFNSYGDAVYVSKSPLGPFTLAKNNPYSYKPGGYMGGAGHGSTIEDKYGNLWHAATSRICINHNFERRIGLWPAGIDEDGELFCNQRYGDWVHSMPSEYSNPWADPKWMLLSYKKATSASSGSNMENAVDEDIRTWWSAKTNKAGEWLQVDLGQSMDVHAVQVNFADDHLELDLPSGCQMKGQGTEQRWIDEENQYTRWILEGSIDGSNYFVIMDKTQVETDLPHDLVISEAGIQARYIRLTITEMPYGQKACVSGIRVFGIGIVKPSQETSNIRVQRDELDMDISWEGDGVGYNVLWGYAPNKLYHSYQVFDKKIRIAALIKNQPVYIRVDSFNENGITKGTEVLKA